MNTKYELEYSDGSGWLLVATHTDLVEAQKRFRRFVDGNEAPFRLVKVTEIREVMDL